MAGLDEVLGPGVPARRPLYGERPIMGRDPGAHAFRRVDRDREHRPVRLGVVLDHRRYANLVAPFGGHREADEAPRVARHEVDVVWLDVLRGEDEVALVLAALVVDEDHHPAVAKLLDESLGGVEAGQLVHAVRSPSSGRSEGRAAGFVPCREMRLRRFMPGDERLGGVEAGQLAHAARSPFSRRST